MKLLRLLFAVLLILTTTSARAESISVMETDPAMPTTLNQWEAFNLRVIYDVDAPVRIRAQAYTNGNPAPAANGGSLAYGPGKGEALFWLSFFDSAHIDHIVVTAEDDKTSQIRASVDTAADVTWTGVAASKRAVAPWVKDLQDKTKQMQKDAQADAIKASQESGFDFLDIILPASPVLYLVLQVLCVWWMQGGWRIAAVIPAGVMSLAIAYVLFATIIGGSNIAPVIIFLLAPLAVLYLLVLGVARFMTLSSR